MLRALLLLSFLFSFNTFANTLLNCDGCTLSQVRSLVYGQNTQKPFTNYYVINFESESLYFYRLHVDQEMGIREITPLSISSSVTASLSEFFEAMDSARNNMDSSLLSEAIAEALGIQQGQSAYSSNSSNYSLNSSFEGATLTSSSTSSCPNSQRLYDYVTTSSVRTQAYYNALNQPGLQPYLQAFNNTWNNFIALTNATVTAGVVEASLPTLTTLVTIESAGQLRITVRPGTTTMDVVDGTVLDCNGNVIPTNINDLPGNYIFANLDDAERFGSYVQYLGAVEIQSTYTTCVTTSYQTTCKPSSKDADTFICTIVIPQCFQ